MFQTLKEEETHSYKAFILKHVFKTFLNKLVGPANEIKIVDVIKLKNEKKSL